MDQYHEKKVKEGCSQWYDQSVSCFIEEIYGLQNLHWKTLSKMSGKLVGRVFQ